MKKFLIQIFLLLLVIGISIFFFSPSKNTPKIDLPFASTPPTISSLQVGNTTFQVEISDTSEKRSKGLSGRDKLDDKTGMLFVFEKLDKYPFWMKQMNFALDFVWIKDEKVVDITENVPPPAAGQKDADLPIYSPKTEVNKVLELTAGSVAKYNIKVGDSVKLINS